MVVFLYKKIFSQLQQTEHEKLEIIQQEASKQEKEISKGVKELINKSKKQKEDVYATNIKCIVI